MKKKQENAPYSEQTPESAHGSGEAYTRGDIVERWHAQSLSGESYENATEALDSVEVLQKFRKKLKTLPFGSFYELFETVTNIKKASPNQEDAEREIDAVLNVMEAHTLRFSPRIADLYTAVISAMRNVPYEPQFEMTREKISELTREGDLRVLTADDTSWDMKLNRIETRLVGYLSGARAIDRREGKEMDDDMRMWRAEQHTEAREESSHPPERRNESKPSMDEMSRLKEGERVPAMWSITPAYGGYYREQSFSKWDSARNTWIEEEYQYGDVQFVNAGSVNLNMHTRALAGKWTSLPVPYTHGIHSIEAGGRKYKIQQDQNGDAVLMVEGAIHSEPTEEVEITVVLAPRPRKTYGPVDPTKIKIPDMPLQCSEETQEAIAAIIKKKSDAISRARALASYTRSRLRYSNESKYNQVYDADQNGYFAAIDQHRQADCDVANTYFAALCAYARIPVRHCVGHSVKGKNTQGASEINSGTGHAWSEVWDERDRIWVRIDATPPGDPNLQEDEKTTTGTAIPGDYGEGPEALRPTDEQLEALRKKLAERKEELSYTKEERELAEATGVERKEARQIVREINEAEQTRLPNGELVVDALARVFNAIIESRKAIVSAYDGPVRRRDGGERIENIVRHRLGILAGDPDPVSREKESEEVKDEQMFGGFDLYIIGDKSGSMSNTVEGEALWQMQRRAEYLIFSSLQRFEKNLERASLQKENALTVRTEGISFRGSDPDDIDIDKKRSPSFTAQDKVALWHSLTNQGGGNGDVAALSYVLNQIKEEVSNIEQHGAKDNRLRLVIACSDGGPDSPVGVQQLAEELGKLHAVVVGVGLTEAAAAVPIIYTTPYSRGDIVRDINDLPALVAKHVVLAAAKLFPEKAHASAMKTLETAIAKFNPSK